MQTILRRDGRMVLFIRGGALVVPDGVTRAQVQEILRRYPHGTTRRREQIIAALREAAERE